MRVSCRQRSDGSLIKTHLQTHKGRDRIRREKGPRKTNTCGWLTTQIILKVTHIWNNWTRKQGTTTFTAVRRQTGLDLLLCHTPCAYLIAGLASMVLHKKILRRHWRCCLSVCGANSQILVPTSASTEHCTSASAYHIT